MRRLLRVPLVLLLLIGTSGTGCRSPRIRERAFRFEPAVRAGVRGVIPASVAATSSEEYAYFISRGRVEASEGATPEGLLALADRADRIGSRLLRRNPTAALPWFRDAAAYATFSLISAGPAAASGPFHARAVDRHNHAVEELIRSAGTGTERTDPAWRAQLGAMGVAISQTAPERAAIPCDALWIAADYRVRNLDQIRRDGLGVPLIVLSRFPDRNAFPDRFLPERLRLPSTAVFRPGGPLRAGAWRSRPATLTLHDPAHESVVALGPGIDHAPLAADLTTPLAHQFINSPLTQFGWGGLLRPETYNSMSGIFLGGPYQPGRIPVLFIHGLWSSPDAWLKMANGLQGDPLVRDRYQFWYAYYPSGAPVMFSALKLRQSLHELREGIDPGRSDPALDQMVVVGHSLGGVLSKQLLQSSGRRLEQGLLTRPFDQVEMSPETRTALARLLFFVPEPSIRRAVFIAAPHRGSNTANQLIGRAGSILVRGPGQAAELHREVLALNGPQVLQPAYRRRPPNSIDNLQWDSPILKALSELPIAPGVPYHSIVANLLPGAPSRLWTDGVVSYESAHLDGAESEIMVRHNHFANDTLEATAEVHRILILHLETVR